MTADSSGFTDASLCVNTLEALKVCKSFGEHTWNLCNKRVLYLRFDNAKDIQEYLGDHGTVLDNIPDYTPQLNETGDRNIRTVMNMMRSMLKYADVSKDFWDALQETYAF